MKTDAAAAQETLSAKDLDHDHPVKAPPSEMELAGAASRAEQVVVIGAGPAGLTAAYDLIKLGFRPVVLEKRDKVGGISCTENYKGFYFDMGGHRFFTKVKEVSELWHEVLGEKLLHRPRSSRIYYNHKFFCYPLKPFNALAGLGIWQSLLAVLSYLKWQIFPYEEESTFEQWVTNRFGQRVFEIFFKTYTEKVWGIACSELRGEWAAQRIKDLSLKSAVLSMFVRPKTTIKTLVEEFDYPRLGPGMLWNEVKGRVERRGGTVRVDSDVVEITRNGDRIESVTISCEGQKETVSGEYFISSMPLRELISKLNPPVPSEVLEAARKLKYRDFLTVCVVVDVPDLFADNWIYIHDPDVRVGRIQNFKNWSPDMVPDLRRTSLGLEYFCNEGDDLWNMADSDLIELAKNELAWIGLAKPIDVADGRVFRVPKAYPVYDTDYGESLSTVRKFVDGLKNFQTIGRNGLHRYNNQDHSMLTGMLAVRNLALGESNVVWDVNAEAEYHEHMDLLENAISRVFTKLDRVAFGLSVGFTTGILLCLATLFLVLKGGEVVGPTMQLLNEYFPGYSVTPWGSILGLAYGFLAGFVGGWGFALLRNATMFLTAAYVRRGAELQALRRVLEYI